MGIIKKIKNVHMKTKLFIYISMLTFTLSLSSCLESGLGELDTYSDANITAINFEYRWAILDNPNDTWADEKLQVKALTTSSTFSEGTIECAITVPVASGTFTEAERAKVSLSNLNAYVTISPGATIKPIGNSPVLGKLGDFSISEISYEVISADNKNKKVWKLVIKGFTK